MTPRQTPDAVREAVAKVLYDFRPGCGWKTVKGRPASYAIPWDEACADYKEDAYRETDAILAALDSRAGEDVRPDSWTAAPEDVRERAQLLADVELHLKSSRVFVTTREKMHPCGVELHDELLGRVTAAIDSIGKAKGHD